MEIQKVVLSEHERELISRFMGEECPSEIDFNWLMPVVEKIESLGYDVAIFKDHTEIFTNYDGQLFSSGDEHESKISTVYNVVLQFIKYYNEEKRSL